MSCGDEASTRFYCRCLQLASCCSLSVFGKDTKLIYRHFATLYFVFAVDQAESELGILDLIQVFVEASNTLFPYS